VSLEKVRAGIEEHLAAVRGLDALAGPIAEAARQLTEVLQTGGKVLLCGNGGSAADAQHIAAELTGRFERERRALPAVALTTDTSAMTAIANDYGFARIFARQVEALGRTGDALVAISTSGESDNVLAAVDAARLAGLQTVGLAGRTGGRLARACDRCIVVPERSTARIQECHILIGHIWCSLIEEAFAT
jgi:D-sedoheptulose 7-phosphate isomerase